MIHDNAKSTCSYKTRFKNTKWKIENKRESKNSQWLKEVVVINRVLRTRNGRIRIKGKAKIASGLKKED